MKYLLATVLLSCIFFGGNAQKPPIKFGDISMEDLQMKIYPKDTTAAAVILADYCEARISPFQGKLIIERHTRIKILKSEGTQWGDVAVRLRHVRTSSESMSGLKAVSYNLENGEVVESKLPNSSVFEEKYNKYNNLKKFTMPNVKVGTVIEYTYKINSDFLDNYPNWKFQYSIPVAYSEFRAYIPNFFIFEKYMQGYLQVSLETKDYQQGSSYTDKLNKYVMKDIPAFKPEPFMTSEADYVSKINLALSHINFPGQPVQEIMGSWEKLAGSLIESSSFGKTITGNNFLKKDIENVIAGIDDPYKKAEAIYNYAKATIEWDGEEDYEAYPVKDILEKKTGTVGDINLVLGSMLEKAGFMVEPVILSTRNHGFIRKTFPMERQFNYVVLRVKIDGKDVFMDATEKYLPMGSLPERCLNGEGMKINIETKTFSWINLETGSKSRTVVNSDMKLSADGSLTGTIKQTMEGYHALEVRKTYASKGEEEYLRDVKRQTQWELENTTFEGMPELNSQLSVTHELTLDSHSDVAGGIIYLSPFFSGKIEENPFKAEKREYPVDFGSPFDQIMITKITMPEGYGVDEVPQPKAMVLPGNAGKFIYNVMVNGNAISITSSFSIAKALFTQTEYATLREFYNQVVAKQAEQIVLKKK